MLRYDGIRKYLFDNGSIRNKAFAAYNLNAVHWVRSQKGVFYDLSVWDRRAVILSSLILSKKEMESWLASLEKSSTNFTELMTIKWVKSKKK